MQRRYLQVIRLVALVIVLLGPIASLSSPVDASGSLGQSATRNVDVVFVMDTSGSMNDEFATLCDEIPRIVAAMERRNIRVNYTVLGITRERNCTTGTVANQISGGTVNHEEDWGPAIRDLSVAWPWKPGYTRLIIPMSDEAPQDGNPCEDPGPDRDAVNEAILAAQRNQVRVVPILGTIQEPEYAECIVEMFKTLVFGFGTMYADSSVSCDQLAQYVSDIIGGVAGDKDGDGYPDDQDPAPSDACKPDPQAVCYPQQVCGVSNTPRWDDDADGRTDEERENGQDDDHDGLVDEDVGGVNCPYPDQDCGLNNHRGFDDDGDGSVDEEIDDQQDSDGDGYIDEDVQCACPPVQKSGVDETPGLDDDHDYLVDEETADGIDNDGDGCVDEDIEEQIEIEGQPVQFVGLPRIGEPVPKFWRYPDQEERLLAAINEARNQHGLETLSRLSVAENWANERAQWRLRAVPPLSDLPYGGKRLRREMLWFYRWEEGSMGPENVPNIRPISDMVDKMAALFSWIVTDDRILDERVSGVGIRVMVGDNGRYGTAIVLGYEPYAQSQRSYESPNNDVNFGLLEPGDILVSSDYNVIVDWSQLIFHGTLWHHAGIYVGNDHVVEAGLGGVGIYSIRDSSFWSAPYAAIYRVQATSKQRKVAAEFARSQVGKPYNFDFFNIINGEDPHIDARYYCSQLVWVAYHEATNGAYDLRTPYVFSNVLADAGYQSADGLIRPDDLVYNSRVDWVSGSADYRIGFWTGRSPVDLYVTDPKGRHVGVNPETGEALNEIPGASFNLDAHPKYIAVPGLLPGRYKIGVAGTDSGNYTIDAFMQGVRMDSHSHVTGVASAESLDTYELNVPEDASVAFDDLGLVAGTGGGIGFVAIAILGAAGGVSWVVLSKRRQTDGRSLSPPNRAASLVNYRSGEPARTLSLSSQGTIIGRGSDCDLRINDLTVSRHHAIIRYARGRWFLQDQGSAGGTFVNGERITATALVDGDRIRIGATRWVFHSAHGTS